MEAVNVVSLVSPINEAELRGQSNRFNPGFFSLYVYCEAGYPVDFLGSLWVLFSPFPEEEPRIAETCQWRVAVKKTDKLVCGLALNVSEDGTWHRDQDFQRSMGGSSYSSLGKYLSRIFSLNQHDGFYCLQMLLSLAVISHACEGGGLTLASTGPVQTGCNKTKKMPVWEQVWLSKGTWCCQQTPTEGGTFGRKCGQLEIQCFNVLCVYTWSLQS